MATAWWSLLVDGVVAVAALVAFLAFIAAGMSSCRHLGEGVNG